MPLSAVCISEYKSCERSCSYTFLVTGSSVGVIRGCKFPRSKAAGCSVCEPRGSYHERIIFGHMDRGLVKMELGELAFSLHMDKIIYHLKCWNCSMCLEKMMNHSMCSNISPF